MGTNAELEALKGNAVRQRIIEGAFRVFSERAIEPVKMPDVAKAAGVGVATVYRYFGTKTDLVLAVGTAVWGKYIRGSADTMSDTFTARQRFEYYLDSFLDLYRRHKDLLRFNQFFNVYISEEGISDDSKREYTEMIDALSARFHRMYEIAKKDRTIRTDVPEREMFSSTLHLMLAAVTRYAVGLVYKGGGDPESELTMLKQMLLREYATADE